MSETPLARKRLTVVTHTFQVASSRIGSDVSGFSQIARLHQQLVPLSGCEVILDCSRLVWFDGHLAASLRTVLDHAASRENSFKLSGLTVAVSATLQKNGFLRRRADDTYKTTIPLTKFGLQGGVNFSLFAKKHLQRREMPQMTEALKNKFYEGVDELFANSALHSKSPTGVHVCGQFLQRILRLTSRSSMEVKRLQARRKAQVTGFPQRLMRSSGRWSLGILLDRAIFPAV